MLARLWELATLFLKLGTIGFGGPAVHIATMEVETVERRDWLTRQHFLDLIGATNLIPGPNSTEIAMHIGYVRAGLLGLVVAGASFILPAVTITMLFAWGYAVYGAQPALQPVLRGIAPAVLAIIFTAGYRLAIKAAGTWPLRALAISVAVAAWLLPGREVLVLLVGSLLGMLALLWLRRIDSPGARKSQHASPLLPWGALGGEATQGGAAAAGAGTIAGGAAVAAPVTLWNLACYFLKVGSVLYGTGYVLIAYLEGGLVEQFRWLTHQQLLDVVAMGQLTPGPILSTATAIGFIVMHKEGGLTGGLAGGAVASVAIFLPSFLLVALLGPLVPHLRRSRTAAAFLDAVNAASMGLLAAVTYNLCLATLTSLPSIIIAAAAIVAVLRWNPSPVWLVAGGAAAGWFVGLFS